MESRMPVSLCLGRKPCLAWSMVLAVARYLDRCEGLFCDAITSRPSEAAVGSSWMVWSSSDSEGLSLKVLSSLPGASREKRRTKWGRLPGSAGWAPCQLFFGSAVCSESVTAVSSAEIPLFWIASASPVTTTRYECGPVRGLRGTKLLSSRGLELAVSYKTQISAGPKGPHSTSHCLSGTELTWIKLAWYRRLRGHLHDLTKRNPPCVWGEWPEYP